MNRERMNLVVVGHVDHGKSTVIGRLLVETDSLPVGKLEEVKRTCERNAKPFEYAFLLDALQNEQRQGITIDTARCFFKSDLRDYIIIDAPGHIEFLKNMVSGAARAEAALLVIDAKEGVRENSRRHGYMLSMLGIRQIVVCVNKMDLVGWSRATFEAIVAEYAEFLARVGVHPYAFIPICAAGGDNLVERSRQLPWYEGKPLLSLIDSFAPERTAGERPFRFPVQDVYKFTEYGDERRIIAGRVEAGTIRAGDEVLFLPSNKLAKIATIEEFNRARRAEVEPGTSIGFTLEPELYVRPGEVMVKRADTAAPERLERRPLVGTTFRVNLFWMGRSPMMQGRRYKLKAATAETPVWLREVRSSLDASSLDSTEAKRQVDLFDVADCVLETGKPIAFDPIDLVPATGRFVIVDGYDIAGGGIVLEQVLEGRSLIEEHIRQREVGWQRSSITPGMRAGRYSQRSTFVVIVGSPGSSPLITEIAKRLEERLFDRGRFVYYLGLSNALLGVQADVDLAEDRSEFLRRLGEVAHLFTDAGSILVTTVPDADEDELAMLATLTKPGQMLVVSVGETPLSGARVDLSLAAQVSAEAGARGVAELLLENEILVEYSL